MAIWLCEVLGAIATSCIIGYGLSKESAFPNLRQMVQKTDAYIKEVDTTLLFLLPEYIWRLSKLQNMRTTVLLVL